MMLTRLGWKQYGARRLGDRFDYWQRNDGKAEVFNEESCGYSVKVYRRYRGGPHKRTGALGRMVLIGQCMSKAQDAMYLADQTLPMAAEEVRG